ncbi:tRNA (carboxymethyluridine(34)-5-O)-methyltransferase alkbh8 isoform X2 [Parasteatoda tepidariorum]|nr:alkylated DNA repair protein alkB homolog 8 isoform X2 [Parasteatoda tepidariorum]XP_015918172.1 alkylated DNA repair protein alkB homolog 8 isoform X2 [Parasteatoda tepidariorum]
MLPRKSYSFVVFNTIHQASTAISLLNGLKLPSNSTFYLAFVKDEDVPEEVSLKNDWPKGLVLLEEFITEEEEKELLAVINKEDDFNDESSLKHRKVKHYGYKFIYGSNNINKNQPLEMKIPDVCIPHLKKLVSLQLLPRIPDQLTVNHYQPGQGIPPHVDTHSPFEDGIVSLSLSSQVVMNFYSPHGEIVSVSLPRRSALVMLGESRYLWKHGITPRKQDIIRSESSGHLTLLARSLRTSLTFRLTREGECNCEYKEHCDSKIST